MTQIYDRIGAGYAHARRPDPRIAARVAGALGGAETVVNVGAGSGSYEPADRAVVAVEPSRTMIAQRPAGSAPVVQASATHLPFADGAFAAAMAVLTVHHWPDRAAGLAELRRVARGAVAVLTWDPEGPGFWLIRDYLPEILEADRGNFPTIDEYAAALGPVRVEPVPVPHDCADGFLGAYWRRPHAYLDPRVRAGISSFSTIPGLDAGLERLRADLEDGTWERRHGELLRRSEIDAGYRLVISGG